MVRVTFLGTGDAFGHGGRLQACYMMDDGAHRFLVDFGASGMTSLNRYNVDPNSIEMILLSHLHGDHFAGLPFYILDAQLHSKRTEPLIIAGPQGTRERLYQAMELMFPGSAGVNRKFETEIIELEPQKTWLFHDIKITPFLVTHACGAPPLAFRIEAGNKVIAYTGDTEWVEDLNKLGHKADLLIAEAYFYEKQIKFHLNYRTLKENEKEMAAKRIILTHMGGDMLTRLEDVEFEVAEDGMSIDI